MNESSDPDETIDAPSRPTETIDLRARADHARPRSTLPNKTRPILLHDAETDSGWEVKFQSDAMPTPEQAGDRYELSGEIARGGMGAILRGHDVDLGRDLAVKVLLEKYANRPDVAQRFIEEAQIGGQLQHPGIVPVYDIGRFGDRPFFTMKLVKGQNLAALLAERADPTTDLSRFIAIALQVSQTLAYAHAKGVIHRDLKPANIMVGAFGEVQVMDWGLAKVLTTDEEETTRPREGPADGTTIRTARSTGSGRGTDTEAGSMLGTPAYMPPEQANGDVTLLDRRADVFGLGAILCEVLTGNPPYVGRSSEVRLKASQGDLTDAISRLDHCSADLELIALTKACLAPKASDRPRDAQAVADALSAYLNGVQERVRRAELAGVEERGRRRLTTVVAASLLVLSTACGLGFTYWLQQRQAAATRVALALREATLHRDQALANPDDPTLWATAQEALKGAETALTGSRDQDARRQLKALQDETRAAAEAAERDRTLLARLLDVRSAKADDEDGSQTDAAYAETFRAAGLDVDGQDPKEVGARIAARPPSARRLIVAALDHWTGVRAARGPQGASWPRLVEAARVADPDPDRDALRATMTIPDKGKRLEQARPLAAKANAGSWAPEGLVMLAYVLADAGDPDEAVRVLRRASGPHPSDAWVHYVLGEQLERTTPSRRAEAIEAYAVARAIRPQLAHELAHVLEATNRDAEAEAVFRDLVERRPQVPRHLACLGRHLKERGRAAEAGPILERAVAVCREVVLAKPDDAVAHAELGNALDASGKPIEAETAFREAIRLQPALSVAHFNLGNVLQVQGKTDEAEREYREAIRLQPNFARAHFNLGTNLHARGVLDEAKAAYHESVRLQPDDAKAHYNLGLIVAAQGKPDEAEAAFRESIRLQPSYAEAHYNLGVVLGSRGRHEEAETAFRAAVRANPDFAEAHCNLGHCLFRQGRFAESLEAMRRGHELGTSRANWRLPSAEWVRQAEAMSLAEANLASLVKGEHQPRDNEERLLLARMCRTKKLNKTGARLLAEAFAADPILADDLKAGYRYDAACFAALVASGVGGDTAATDDNERADFLKRALDWLRADLALRTKQLEEGRPTDRAEVERIMKHWREDPDLAGIRDADALAKLPEKEREACRELWADVDELAKRATAP